MQSVFLLFLQFIFYTRKKETYIYLLTYIRNLDMTAMNFPVLFTFLFLGALRTTEGSSTAPSPSSADIAGASGELKFDNSLSGTYAVASNKSTIEFDLTLSRLAWVGVAIGNNGMTNADMVICSGGSVKRYWSTGMVPPTSGTSVPGATCSQSGSKTVMKFTRNVEKSGNQQNSISLKKGEKTAFSFAYGGSGEVSLMQHKVRGRVKFDIGAGGTASEAEGPQLNAAMWTHGLCMSLAWGTLLPSGVVVAHFGRDSKKQFNGKIFWFGYHRTINAIGWLLQIVGFIGAVVYVSMTHGTHFGGGHTYVGLVVVILGTLQPVNAYFRPHNPALGEEKSTARKRWELLHIGSGYTATVLGFLNCILGALFAQTLFKPGNPLFIATLAVICVGGFAVIGYACTTLFGKENRTETELVNVHGK